MGYGHVWYIKNRKKWIASWPRLVADTRNIVDAADIDLTSDRIWDLREVRNGYGGSDDAIQKLLDPPLPIVDEKIGIIFNGIQNDGCEPFVLERLPKSEYGESNRLSFSCKTNRRPYDTIVCAVLIRAKTLLGDSFYAGIPLLEDMLEDDDGWARAASLLGLLWPEDSIPLDRPKKWNGADDETDDQTHDQIDSMVVPPTESLIEITAKDKKEKEPRRILPLDLANHTIQSIAQWINDCESKDIGHETCRSNGRQRHLPLMRLIDIERGSIVSAPSNPSYVALSYVWGSSQQTSLLSSNISQLMEDDVFEKQNIHISKTIADSMALCQRLGYRYLWVDALCILQDNAYDKVLQLNTMRDVYSNAVFTIAAARGDHADCGLGLTTKDMTPVTITKTQRSDIWPAFTNVLVESVWDRRAWTFQEKVLSRRLLVSSEDGLFFVCGTRVCNELGYQLHDTEHISQNFPGCFRNVDPTSQLESYLAAVQHYSQRKLTMESDYENAIRGITKAFGYSMNKIPNNFFQGIPTSCFDEIICWRVAQHNPSARRSGFPSWSWTGWKQTPLFPQILISKINQKTEAGIWGSHILAYDRGNSERIKNLESYGINTAGPNPIMLTWKGAPLEIAMESTEDIGTTNGLFAVFSPFNGQHAGAIQLDKEWRARQGATMEFLPIFVQKVAGMARIKMLMCLELSNEPSRNLSGPEDSWERVQVMDCDLGEQDWLSMIKESPESRERRTGWIF